MTDNSFDLPLFRTSLRETPLVESPVRESKSNGKIERAIREVQGHFWTMRHHSEIRLGTQIDNDTAIAERLIVWTADILTKFVVLSSGCVLSFPANTKPCGEKVYFQYKVQASERDPCGNSKSEIGCFG